MSVPNLGTTEDSARRALQRAGLRAVFKNDSSTAAKGRVIGSLPKAGKKVEPGSRVTVFLSLADLVKVPDVVGSHMIDSPSSTLEAEGLNTQIECFDGDGVGGTVDSQSPKGGAEVKKGTTVTLRVFNGFRIDASPCMR